MKTQISRNTFKPGQRYSGVYQQQGRMLTDADWNELMNVMKTRVDEAIRDAIGSGAPRDRGLAVLDNFRLQPGHLYVDGIHAELPGTAAVDFTAQQDFSEAQALPLSGGSAPSGYVLYADVWERPVLALEDGDLLDPGLHGADTCTRTRTMLQVKWCPAGVDPADTAVNPRHGNAPLTLALWRSTAAADPCDPCAIEVALDARVGNYLFRVEVHDWKGNNDGSGELTLKWSGENGAEQHKVGQLPMDFDQGDWIYEFFNLACEQNPGVHLATGFSYSRGQLLAAYPAATPVGRPWVRRWDGYCVLTRSSGGAWSLKEGMDKGVTLSTGLGTEAHGHALVDSALELNLMSMALNLELDSRVHVAGDYWLAAVREAVHQPGDTLLDAAAPEGIVHHYLWLADLDAGGHVQAFADDQVRRRFEFPPLSDLWAENVGYDNAGCSETPAENVQEALDWLCQQRDLRFHNKHLHGWGIVCGLQVECGPDTLPEANEDEGKRREVSVRKGYAIDCEGHDVVMEGPDSFDLLALVEAHDTANPAEPILKEGEGSVALTVARGASGEAEFKVEKYDPKKENNWEALLDGTLLMDFYQHCIKDLVEALQDELTADPEEQNALVGPTLRRWITLFNLIIQIFNYDNGRYVFLSNKEHEILKKFYQRLQELLRSKTFCAMFEGDVFPDYPFPDTKLSTIFAKGWHTRLRLAPDGRQAYTCGAANNTIHEFNLEKEEMIQVIEMPAGEGARVVDVALHPEGKLLVAIASLSSGDTVVGMADIEGESKYVWRPVRVLCGLKMSNLVFSAKGDELWMIGMGAGLFVFKTDAILSETERPEPKYTFNACGHVSIDLASQRAVATASSGTAVTGVYNRVVGMKLDVAGSNLAPQISRALTRPDTGAVIYGSDDVLLVPAKDSGAGAMLCVVTHPWDNKDENKHILVYDFSENAPESIPLHNLLVEKTIVRLAWHGPSKRLLASLEDGYRLQLFNLANGQTTTQRHPVQISPISIAVNAPSDRVYVLNGLSNTLSVIPGEALETSQDFLDQLEGYRGEALAAFWGLAGSLLQYLKDCFCHHLLIKCPECEQDEDRLYLAGIEVRDNKIYKVCNFAKRKYVKSFPTMSYWLSLVPVAPLLQKAVEKLCCLVFPDLFGNLYQKYAVGSYTHAYAKTGNQVESSMLRKGIQMFQGADFKTLWSAEKKNLNVYKLLTRDFMLNRVEASAVAQPGVSGNQVLETDVEDAQQRLERQGVQVESVKTYDRMQDAGKFAAYREAPLHLPPDAKVTLYEQNGKVVFYTLAEENGVAGISPEVKAEIDSYERRKAALRDLAEVNAEYARVEARRAEMANLTASREELEAMEKHKGQMQQEVGALKVELAGLQAQRSELSGAVAGMRSEMETLVVRQKEILTELVRAQPVRALPEVDADTAKRLTEAGVLTLADLAKADATTFSRANIDAATAKQLVKAAELRLTLR
ncbi:MAG: DUF6519 domain-containing protein [Sulfurimicrobium sp.]|nr:DUF6519 domain-containing protein [Sulfurimicrobium sp.]